MLQLQLIAVFGNGVAMASWMFCCATLNTWGRFIRKKFHWPVEEHMKTQKHKLIARAYAGRKKFKEGDAYSIYTQNHTDPVGLQFELNSAASNCSTSHLQSWANNLARLMNRRQAVPNDIGMGDSDYSVNYRHVSIESRRNSGDSQVSVQIAELKATKTVKSRKSDKYKFRKRRSSRDFDYSSRAQSRADAKRDSSTSMDSHLQFLNAMRNGNSVGCFAPNPNRRTGNAGLDESHIRGLLMNEKLVLPLTHTSEDESLSVTISETAVNMRVANQTLDLNDHFTISQLKGGLHIHQLSSSDSDDEENRSNKDHGQEKRYSRNGRGSHSSKRSRKSKKSFRKRYSSESGSQDGIQQKNHSDTSSCTEIKHLAQSSFNSSISEFEKTRGSRQSKTSMDVAVQANAHDLDLEMNNTNNEDDKISKSKQAKTRENKKYRRVSKYNSDVDSSKNYEKIRKSKEKYKYDGNGDEKFGLYRDSNKNYSDYSDEGASIVDKNKVILKKSKELASNRKS